MNGGFACATPGQDRARRRRARSSTDTRNFSWEIKWPLLINRESRVAVYHEKRRGYEETLPRTSRFYGGLCAVGFRVFCEPAVKEAIFPPAAMLPSLSRGIFPRTLLLRTFTA